MKQVTEEFLTSLLHEDSLDIPEHLNAIKDLGPQLSSALNAPIPYTGRFTKEVLIEVPEFKWLKGVKCNLIHNDTTKSDTEFLEGFYNKLYKKAKLCDSEMMGVEKDLPMIAIDLETTGLNTSIRMIGGKLIKSIDLVGVCLAVSGKEGYYLPILHTEEDGIKNLDLTACLNLLQKIVDNFYQIYHNAFYDQEVTSIHKLRMNTHFADTLLIANNLGLRDWDGVYSLGLKFLSGFLLERKMLEINELMGSKAFVRFNRIAAKDAEVYGCFSKDVLVEVEYNEGKEKYISISQIDHLLKTKKNVKIKTADGFQPVKQMFDNGIKDTYNLYLDNGMKINGVTLNHKIDTKQGMKEVKHLCNTDEIQTTKGYSLYSYKLYKSTENVYDIEVDHPNHRYIADGISVHNCSDAMNTYALFEEMILKSKDYDNPYMYNRLAMTLDTKVLNHLRGMFRHGFPLDYKVARGNFKTLINRILLFQSYFYSYSITAGKSIGSAEQINVMFGSVLAEKYLERYNITLAENMDWNSKRIMACKKALYEDFGLEMKIKKLKNSQKLTFATRKIGTTGVKVLEWIRNNIDKWDFIEESLRDDIYWIANIVDKYRSMITEQGRLGKMLRYSFNDSANMTRFNIALRLNGADCVIKGTRVKVRYVGNIVIENLQELLKIKKKVEINTPDGWQCVTDFIIKKNKPCYMIRLENGLSCGGAEQHLFQQSNSFIFIKDLQVGDILLTEQGNSKVISKEFIGVQDVYDITVNHENHRYFSNGISSHNTSRFSNMSGKGSFEIKSI